MKYKIIFFDWYKTLSFSKFWGIWKGTKLEDNIFKVQDAIFGKPNLIREWMEGKHTSEDIVRFTSDKTNLPYDLIQNGLIESAQKMEFISKDSKEKILALKNKGLKVVIATDNMDVFTRWTVPSLKLNTIFDDILSSWEKKSLKSSKNHNNESLFFKDYLKRKKIKSGESVLIDDDIDNKVVKDFGIDFIHVQKGQIEKVLEHLTHS